MSLVSRTSSCVIMLLGSSLQWITAEYFSGRTVSSRVFWFKSGQCCFAWQKSVAILRGICPCSGKRCDTSDSLSPKYGIYL
uniref:Secreted protein n=1 Tax=Rhipicephalus appendiculatus TaxID=34631 RepID=A0A131YDL1_RHIAP